MLSRGTDVVPIPGTKRRKWLRENIAAHDIVLSDEDVAALEAAVPRDAVRVIATVGDACATSTADGVRRSRSSRTTSHHAITSRVVRGDDHRGAGRGEE